MAGTVTQGRRLVVERLLDDVARWARSRADVDAVALVGSYARDGATMASDVDLVVLSASDTELAGDLTWFSVLRPEARLVRSARWGPVAERRFVTGSGLEVELGLASPTWAAVPLDGGTRRVLADGHRVLHDPHGTLARAREALGEPS